MSNPRLSLVAGCMAVMLAGCLIPSDAYPKEQRRTLTQVVLEQVEDTPETRARYPFLVETFETVRKDSKATGETDLPSLQIAVIDKQDAKTEVDLAFAQLSGSLYCGVSSGCQFHAYALNSDKTFVDLLNAMAQTSNSFFLSHCPSYTSLLLMGGHEKSIGWNEFRYTGASMKQIATYKDLSDLPECSAQ